jgi:hypothetical protein
MPKWFVKLVHLVVFIIKKNIEKVGNKSCDGSDDRPPPDKCGCGVARSMMCVLVSCSNYVISFAISSFNSQLSVFFFLWNNPSWMYPHNQKSSGVKSGDDGWPQSVCYSIIEETLDHYNGFSCHVACCTILPEVTTSSSCSTGFERQTDETRLLS